MSYPALASVLVVLLILSGAYYIFQTRSPYIDRKIAGPTTISNEWVEITPNKTLEPKGDYQEIGLRLAVPYVVPIGDKPSAGVKMPDGSKVVPEVEIVDVDGNKFTLKISGSRGDNVLEYRLRGDQVGRKYRTVRIRAEREIQLTSVYWTGFVIKNMP
jgi:hypothetical protein